MMTYLVFPIISLFVATGAMRHAFARTGNSWVSGGMGIAAFIFSMGMTGNLAYGCLLAGLLLVVVISWSIPPARS